MQSEAGSPEIPPRLLAGEIHLWMGRLDDGVPEEAESALSPDEISRRDRLRMPHLRRRFGACRGLLRRLAGHYLGRPAASIVFTYGAQGKPAIEGLEFNLSHSGERLAAAFSRNQPLGLDIEEITPRIHARDIATRYFTVRERSLLDTPDDTVFLRRFFQLWTAKEAVMKATGLGFALALDRITIGLDPLCLLALDHPGSRAWNLIDVAPAADCAGTLACPPGCSVRSFHLPPPGASDVGICGAQR